LLLLSLSLPLLLPGISAAGSLITLFNNILIKTEGKYKIIIILVELISS